MYYVFLFSGILFLLMDTRRILSIEHVIDIELVPYTY